MDDETTEQAIETTLDVLSVAGSSLIGTAAGLAVALLLGGVFGLLARGRAPIRIVYRRIKAPVRLLLMVVGATVGFYLATRLPPDAQVPGWRGTIQHSLIVAIIVAITWLVAGLANVAEDFALKGVRERAGDGEVSTHGRRIQTQAVMLRRVGVVVIWVIGIAVVLLTFPGARAAGASMLASAGVLSVVAGIAAQGTLANLFAGIQLAFTDAIRVDDTIVIEGEYGYIEEITLTYVVVLTWDNRRIILPSSHFTTNPFENWTRRETSILGTVTFDVDWRVPVPAMRVEMQRLLDRTPLWDKNLGIFQVFDAVGGYVTVRALVSAKDPGTLVDLRYYLREELLDFLQTRAPYALPRTRIEDIVPPPDAFAPPRPRDLDDQAELDADLAELADLDKEFRDQARAQEHAAQQESRETIERRKHRESAARRARRRAAREDRRRARESGGAIGRSGPVGRHDDTGSQTTVMSTEALEEALAASRSDRSAPSGQSPTSTGRRGTVSDARPGRRARGAGAGAADVGAGTGAPGAAGAGASGTDASATGASAPSAGSAAMAGQGPVGWTARSRTSAVSAISAGSANTAAVYPPGYPDDMVRTGSADVPGLHDEYPLGPLRTSLVYRFGRGLSAPSARSAAPAGKGPMGDAPTGASKTAASATTGTHASSMYTGSPENEERGAKFTGPDEAVQAELEANVERRRAASTGENLALDGDDDSAHDPAAVAFGSVATGGGTGEGGAAEEHGEDALTADERPVPPDATPVVEGPVEVTGDLGAVPSADVRPARSGETSVLPAVEAESFAGADAEGFGDIEGDADGAWSASAVEAESFAGADAEGFGDIEDDADGAWSASGADPETEHDVQVRDPDEDARGPRGREVVYGRDGSDLGAGTGEGGAGRGNDGGDGGGAGGGGGAGPGGD